MTPQEPPPGEWPDERPASELEPRSEPFLFRILRSTIAPPVLGDAGHDAPLSRRGRILFWGTVSVLVVAIFVLFLATASR
jgi:hypothetical protein